MTTSQIYNGVAKEVANNLDDIVVTGVRNNQTKDVLVSALTEMHEFGSKLNNTGVSFTRTGNSLTGLTTGNGTGPQITVDAYQFKSPASGTFTTLHWYIPQPNTDAGYTTATSVLNDNCFVTLSAADKYYINYTIGGMKVQTVTASGSIAIGDVVKISSVDTATGNLTVTKVTATSDSPYGMAIATALGGTGTTTNGNKLIILRAGLFNYSSPTTYTVGPAYFSAAAVLTSTPGSKQIGTVVVDATLTAKGLIEILF